MDKIYFCKKGDIYSRKIEGIMSKKKSRVIKVNVIYGDKNLKECMKQVIQKCNG